MTGRQMASIIVVIGVGLLVVSLLADIVRIGDDPGFGTQQTLGTAAGAVIAAVGLILARKAAS